MTIELSDVGVTGLRTAVARALPHMTTDWPWGGLLLDLDGTHLYAVATERHTLAIGRAEASRPAPTWRAHIAAADALSLGRFLNDTDPRDTVFLTYAEYGDEGVPEVRLRGRHASHTVSLTGKDDFPDWREIAAKALEQPAADEPVCFTLHMFQRWAAVGEQATFSHRGAHRAVVVTADDFLGFHMPCRLRTSPTPALDDWHEAITRPRKDTAMPDTTGPVAHLRELAVDFRTRTDQARAQARREREEHERQDIATRAPVCMERLFPQTLGLGLSPEAWQGYPGGQEDARPMAVAHLGEGMFVTYERRTTALDDPWASSYDVVVLLRPCSCGKYIESVIDSDYSLALVLADAEIVTACVSDCTPSGEREEG
ncbi:hypothetical protein B7P34_13445 [Streptosporangium nondiastaticum]|uniref:Uncharacterized protein n=1 Tax=Streptosporangium nondiastaticum TaxID=35764 RepID=A0A9X7JQW6_9ACTN|nr:hypothetical protein [Streptosporangium nondiastaticum]PSJ28234.1 hypothetical protein B7P34_13445 [Streptosporangium nondiastaticum]